MRLKTAWHELYQWTKQKATGCCVVVVILAECNYISFNLIKFSYICFAVMFLVSAHVSDCDISLLLVVIAALYIIIYNKLFFLPQVRHWIRLPHPESSAGTIRHPRFFHLH